MAMSHSKACAVAVPSKTVLLKPDEILDFQLERLLGYLLNSIIIPRVPERPQNSEQMRRSFKNRALKNFINELKASKRIVEASRAGPEKTSSMSRKPQNVL